MLRSATSLLTPAVELDQGTMRYFCQTCPYIYNIDRKVSTAAGPLVGVVHWNLWLVPGPHLAMDHPAFLPRSAGDSHYSV